MTVPLPPIDTGNDPFLTDLREWFDDLLGVAITAPAASVPGPITAALIQDLYRVATTAEHVHTTLLTLFDTAGHLARLNHPEGGTVILRLDELPPDTHPGWIHGARTVAAAAAGDDIEPFLNIEHAIDPDFALRVLASAIAFTIDYAHTWLHRNHQDTT